jgi:Lon protease-like protein
MGTDRRHDSATEHELVEVAVFPLTRVTLFPQMTKPLNIFEPRYIKMLNDAMKNDILVALVFTEPTSQKVQEVGVKGRLRAIAGVGRPSLLERRDDGSMLILLEAVGKVRLENVIEDEEPYLKASARWIRENRDLSSQNIFVLHRLMKDLGRWMNVHVQDEDARQGFMAKLTSAEHRINAICSLMVLDSDMQQALLEVDSIDERCAQLAMSIESEGTSQ